ncbi:MAG: hypothetical protein HC837_00490 [Chloroflexaceae bacterium]|nr:hypothetical protein [Chloroflexaceae bacterium]
MSRSANLGLYILGEMGLIDKLSVLQWLDSPNQQMTLRGMTMGCLSGRFGVDAARLSPIQDKLAQIDDNDRLRYLFQLALHAADLEMFERGLANTADLRGLLETLGLTGPEKPYTQAVLRGATMCGLKERFALDESAEDQFQALLEQIHDTAQLERLFMVVVRCADSAAFEQALAIALGQEEEAGSSSAQETKECSGSEQ